MHKNYNIYYFIDRFNIKELSNINKKINIIYRNYKSSNYLDEVLKIKKFCKKKKFKFYLANNTKIAKRLRLDGVYLPSFNKNLKYSNLNLKNGFKIIGSAHNINEIKIKEKQNCEYIFLSPLFKTNKHKYYLDVIKFNLISNVTKRKIVCLGGINSSNLKKINLTKSNGIAAISWIKKKRPK
tara:strand:+ start:330 stop:875 length:546 start_codon:yes stop_codon:yes gene_type:complete